jgi:hypothetical protein
VLLFLKQTWTWKLIKLFYIMNTMKLWNLYLAVRGIKLGFKEKKHTVWVWACEVNERLNPSITISNNQPINWSAYICSICTVRGAIAPALFISHGISQTDVSASKSHQFRENIARHGQRMRSPRKRHATCPIAWLYIGRRCSFPRETCAFAAQYIVE